MENLAIFIAVLLLVFVIARLQPTRNLKPKQQVTNRPSAKKASRTKSRRQRPQAPRPVAAIPLHRPPPPVPASHQLKGKAYIIDGDTIVVDKVKVRLAGIDAPELDQPWGQKSKWEMVNICKGKVIRVDLTGETSYDRLVGTCYLPDGRDIGAEIIKAGLALDGGHYSKGKYRHLEVPGVRKRLRSYGRWR